MSPDTDLATLGRIPIDLRIGVTGHRWIPSDDPEINAVVRTTLTDLLGAANQSTDVTPVGCTVVSSLAEGADRVVAKVGLELGARLEAVLPLPVAEYEKDFESERSRREFHTLLDRASTVEVIDPLPSRPESYRGAGQGVVDRVDVLVAVWDGAPSAGTGGTAEIVQYAKALDLPTRVLLVTRGARVAIEGEQSSGPPVGPLTPAAFLRLDRHNRARLRAKEQQVVRAALQGGEHADWLPYYLRADLLALRYQRLHRWVNRLLYILAVLAVALASGGLVLHTTAAQAWIEFADLGLLVAVLLLARHTDLLGRWTAARFVAERLRSAMFLADVRATPSFALQPSGTADVWVRADWAARAMRELWFRTRRVSGSTTSEESVRRIEDGWIKPQLAYHETVLRRSLRRQRSAGFAVVGLFALSMVAAVLHAIDFLEFEHEFWTFVSIVAPAAGAAISGYAAQREYARQVLRSRQVIRDLQAVRRALEAAPSAQGVQVVAAQIDALVHSDAAEWFVTASLHEPELP